LYHARSYEYIPLINFIHLSKTHEYNSLQCTKYVDDVYPSIDHISKNNNLKQNTEAFQRTKSVIQKMKNSQL